MYNRCPLLFVFCFFCKLISAQTITGTVTNQLNEKLSFASIIIKGTTTGVSANAEGFYSIDIAPGDYTFVCQHVGYQSVEKKITVTKNTAALDFELPYVEYSLKDVVVKNGGEDPAYEIIRNAIKKRPEYENELKEFECNVYIKGQLQMRNYPDKFFGNPVDFGDGDTSKKKIIFLSETVAHYSVKLPQSKVDVISTRVSGNSDGFGFSFPQIISFYNNNIQIGKNLNPRGFISPIADNALNFYNYKFEGSFFDNGKMINRIEVIPKRKYEPLFNGYINIIEDSWRIYSVQFSLLKENQLQLLDTLKIEQTYIPVNDVWVIKQQVIYPSIKLLGFDGFGDFVQVYDSFNLHPSFAKNYFNATVLKFEDSSQKKSAAYWDSIRPVPLQPAEIADYKKKDSLELAHKDPHYLDSVDRKKNKINIAAELLTGQTFNKEKIHFSYFQPAAIDILNYNTVEGLVIGYSPEINKTWKNKQRLSFSPTVRYGFSNHHFNAHITGAYNFRKKYTSELFFSGGQRIFQFNNDQPVVVRSNTIASLLYRENNLKIYQAAFGKLGYSKGFGDGITISASAEYQNRIPLENTTDYSWTGSKKTMFTPNYPVEITDSNIPHHQALTATLNIKWQPGAKYVEFPDRKINIGSKYPTINATVTQGIYKLFSSDVDYTKWSLGISDDINLKIAGKLSYHVVFGGFLNSNKVFIPDYNQYLGNRGTFASEYLNCFQLMYYYQFSNISKFYSEAHVEYHLNGLLSNKIPVMRKLDWFFVIGANALHISVSQYYYEGFISIENIFKIGRVDFVQAFLPNSASTSGIRISLSGLLEGPKEN